MASALKMASEMWNIQLYEKLRYNLAYFYYNIFIYHSGSLRCYWLTCYWDKCPFIKKRLFDLDIETNSFKVDTPKFYIAEIASLVVGQLMS